MGGTTYVDFNAPAGANLAYVVVARFTDGKTSGISNFARITTAEVEADAVPVTVGVANNGNCLPFMCSTQGALGPLTRYQQIYTSSAFEGPTQIDSLTFFMDVNESFNVGRRTTLLSGTYTISLSTTSRSLSGQNGLSTDPAANIGADNLVIGTLVVSGDPSTAAAPLFTITASTPFVYDPAGGNLLVDIVVTGQESLPNGSINGFLDADQTGTATTRAVVFTPSTVLDSFGLVTTFNYVSPIN